MSVVHWFESDSRWRCVECWTQGGGECAAEEWTDVRAVGCAQWRVIGVPVWNDERATLEQSAGCDGVGVQRRDGGATVE